MKPELVRANRHVGDRLRLLRKKMGLTQKDIAGLLGVTHQQIGKYEDGSDRISAGGIFILARRFGVDLGFFFEGFANLPAEGFAEEPGAGYAAEPVPATEGHRLDEAFTRIRSQKLRSLAVRLVEVVASEEEGESSNEELT